MNSDVLVPELAELIRPYQTDEVWLTPMHDNKGRRLGNHGDALMHDACGWVLDRIALDVSGSAERCGSVFVPPNGALLETYEFPDLLASRIAPHRDKPLVLLPSSAKFDNRDPSFMFEDRTAPTLWLLREQRSYDSLTNRWGASLAKRGVTLALHHDMVVTGADRIRQTFRPTPEDSAETLVVARLGVEATDMRKNAGPKSGAGAPGCRRALVTVSRSLPTFTIRPVRRVLARSRQEDAVRRVLDQLAAALPDEAAKLRPYEGPEWDLSDPSLVSYSQYKRSIERARTVVTNRLHVAIPSAILGKRVFLCDSGYHKLSGVYERSLSCEQNVKLVPRGCE